MRKKILFTMLLCTILLSVFISNNAEAGISKINITNSNETIYAGKSYQMAINGVKAKKVKWKSSNKKVATVDKKGKVKGISAGKATITGKYKGITFKTKFTVKENSKAINKVLCEDERLKVTLKEIKGGKIYITLENKYDKEIEVFGDVFEIDGESYSDDIWEYIQPGFKCNCKLLLYDADGKTVDYKFDKGNFKGSFTYYYTNDYDSKTITFDVDIK